VNNGEGAPFDADGPPRRDTQRAKSIAVVPLYGVLAQRMDLMTETSGGTSTDRFRREFQAAVDDPDVAGIVIEVDSPGGSVLGLTEAADAVFHARGQKPIYAVANSEANSAAYFIASAADKLFVAPDGQVGSIGTVAIHQDVSGMLEKDGVVTTIISTPEGKAEGNQYQPLADEARERIAFEVQMYYDRFVSAVARNRGTTEETVRLEYGRGRSLMDTEALEAGMVDGIFTMDETINLLAKSVKRGTPRRNIAQRRLDLLR